MIQRKILKKEEIDTEEKELSKAIEERKAIQNDSSNISAENDHWSSASVIDEKAYTDEVSKWIDEGATILAGCCRTRPSHIKEMTERLRQK